MKSLLCAMAAGLSLVWPPNPGPVSGYRAYYGPASHVYTNAIDAGAALSIPLPPSPRPFYAVVAPYSTNGVEADFSAEMAYPQPVVVGYKLQCSPNLTSGWTNVVSHSVTNAGMDGGLFFRVVMDVRFQ